MATSARTSSVRQSFLQRWDTTREDLRRSRQARSARRELANELATYTTRTEIDDLLATMRSRDETSDAEIRAVVVGNLWDDTRLVGIGR